MRQQSAYFPSLVCVVAYVAECSTIHCQSYQVQGLWFRHNGEKDLRCMSCVQITTSCV
jgi:hypothetical protein